MQSLKMEMYQKEGSQTNLSFTVWFGPKKNPQHFFFARHALLTAERQIQEEEKKNFFLYIRKKSELARSRFGVEQ